MSSASEKKERKITQSTPLADMADEGAENEAVDEAAVVENPANNDASDDESSEWSDIEIFLDEHTDKAPRDRTGYIRLRDKLFFVLGVANVCILAIGAFDTDLHWFLPYYYTIKFPFLIGYRFFTYRKLKYHLFLLDFCYWCNTALLIYMWVLPHNPHMFYILFALTNAPLAFAILAFRNSLVFHSIDKITSLFIHASPPILTYLIRYYPQSTARHWYTDFASCIPESGTVLPSGDSDWHSAEYVCATDYQGIWYLTLGLPLAAFMAHSVLYFIIVQTLPCTKHWRRDKRYLTSFRFLTSRKGGLLHKFVNSCGRKMRPFMFGVFNWIFCLVTLIPTIFYLHIQVLHVAYLLILVTMATWNGANFYFEVFARKYEGVRRADATKKEAKQ